MADQNDWKLLRIDMAAFKPAPYVTLSVDDQIKLWIFARLRLAGFRFKEIADGPIPELEAPWERSIDHERRIVFRQWAA
jgi:hypothetical protein